jgi:hypothetical protein
VFNQILFRFQEGLDEGAYLRFCFGRSSTPLEARIRSQLLIEPRKDLLWRCAEAPGHEICVIVSVIHLNNPLCCVVCTDCQLECKVEMSGGSTKPAMAGLKFSQLLKKGILIWKGRTPVIERLLFKKLRDLIGSAKRTGGGTYGDRLEIRMLDVLAEP